MMWAPIDPSTTPCLYRAEGVRYASMLDEFEQPTGPGRAVIQVRTYRITSYTAQGAWIDLHGEPRFVNLRAVKQYASASEAEARDALRARKHRQITILESQLHKARAILAMMEEK